MRKFLVWILSLSLVLGSQARARDVLTDFDAPGTAKDGQRYFDKVNRLLRKSATQLKFLKMDPQTLKKLASEGRKKALQYPKSAVPHMAQTMMLLWVLGGVEAARQNYKMSPLQSEQTSPTDMMLQVGDQMINSFDLFAGMAGASASATLLAMPINSINELIASKVTQPMLKTLLISGATSFVTFVGWEAGAKLWEQSILQLDAKDIEAAKSLRFLEIMRGGGTAEQQRIFKEILGHAYSILTWADPEVSSSWVYNTWRQRILTGEFVTMLTSMVAAGVVAGSLAPGAGTVIGFCFGLAGGLAGGLVAVLLPHSAKQPVTDGFRRRRVDYGYNLLGQYQNAAMHFLWNSSYPLDYQEKMSREYLDGRVGARDGVVTALFEQVYDASMRRQEADTVLQMIKAHPASAGVDQLNRALAVMGQSKVSGRLADLRQEYEAQLKDANERIHFYMSEMLELQRREAISLGALGYAEETPQELRASYLREIDRQSELHMALKYIYAGLLPERAAEMNLDLSEQDQQKIQVSAQVLLNLFYIQAFTEKTFLQ